MVYLHEAFRNRVTLSRYISRCQVQVRQRLAYSFLWVVVIRSYKSISMRNRQREKPETEKLKFYENNLK